MFDIFKTETEFHGQFSEEEAKKVEAQRVKDKVHLKQLLTILSKKKMENLLPVRKQMVVCEKQCYKSISMTEELTVERVDELRDCKSKCRNAYTDLTHFLDNINFLSENKMKMYMKSCASKLQNPQAYDECMWGSYNKLDRRYKEYWLKQKESIVQRHYFKSSEELGKSFAEKAAETKK